MKRLPSREELDTIDIEFYYRVKAQLKEDATTPMSAEHAQQRLDDFLALQQEHAFIALVKAEEAPSDARVELIFEPTYLAMVWAARQWNVHVGQLKDDIEDFLVSMISLFVNFDNLHYHGYDRYMNWTSALECLLDEQLLAYLSTHSGAPHHLYLLIEETVSELDFLSHQRQGAFDSMDKEKVGKVVAAWKYWEQHISLSMEHSNTTVPTTIS